jgi:hypothetical protein
MTSSEWETKRHADHKSVNPQDSSPVDGPAQERTLQSKSEVYVLRPTKQSDGMDAIMLFAFQVDKNLIEHKINHQRLWSEGSERLSCAEPSPQRPRQIAGELLQQELAATNHLLPENFGVLCPPGTRAFRELFCAHPQRKLLDTCSWSCHNKDITSCLEN